MVKAAQRQPACNLQGGGLQLSTTESAPRSGCPAFRLRALESSLPKLQIARSTPPRYLEALRRT